MSTANRPQLPLDLGFDSSPVSRQEFLLHELYTVLVQTFTAIGPISAETLALRAIEAIADHLGGQEIYLPRGDRLRLAIRNRDIMSKLETGVPIWKVAHEYGLSVERIRQILHKQQ